ncbi:type III pantothenate kinase [Fulvivirgaceae bacterium BMA10]|uniref:Type III pantothenate kinase n=1 Tax=Splendidivirga corallicola TaxID=3051826 RepID=A0ABT8KZJ1_9BACT|nr:type III pantothenate kinase [Fulvivirgaceae bacterium BMA10]
MLLAVDIGNTDITFGLSRQNEWIFSWRIKSEISRSVGAYELELRNYFLENDISLNDIHQVVISSVVPSLTSKLEQVLQNSFTVSPLILGPSIYPDLKVTVRNANEIGTDLVANAVAAFHHFNDPCIVVDFGTALTFTTIDSDGKLMGVAIAPGIKTAMKSLSSNTAQLPEVPLQLPDSALGKDTIHAMQAGILIGYVGLVKEMLTHIKKEINKPCKVIATGGLSSVLTPLRPEFDEINNMLTLDGLRVIATNHFRLNKD